MLTAIRNIYSIVTNYDERRLGSEESMEFCRRGAIQPRVSVFTRIWKAIVAPRQQDISILKN